jgi:filamentous hemagglutinin
MSTTGAAAGVLQAGIATLATQASVSMINNGGKLSATLSDLGASANTRALLTSMATAGVVSGLGSAITIPNGAGNPIALNQISATSSIGQQLTANIINNTASAVVTSAINGTNLSQSLQNGIINAFISTGAAQEANAIGTAVPANINQFANLTAHAIAGCIASSATNASTGSGNQGSAGNACAAGAIGAAVGEYAASVYDPTAANADKDTVAFASMMGGIAVAATGGNAAQIQAGASAAGNAVENNYLLTGPINAAVEALKKCTGDACTAALNSLRSQQQSVARVTEGCRVGRSDCLDQVREIMAGLALLQDPSVIAAMGEANAKELYNRQRDDFTRALDAMQYGANTAEQRRQIALVGAALVGTAVGGWAIAAVGRVLVATCANPFSPACVALGNDLALATFEAATGGSAGVNAVAGTGAAAATVMGQRLANAARLGDEAVAAEMRLIQAEGVATVQLERTLSSAANRYPDLARPQRSTAPNLILGELDLFGRPTGATAVINSESVALGTSANSSIRPPGFGGQAENHAKGHLIANSLGGSGDDARNLVTIFQRNANHPNMSWRIQLLVQHPFCKFQIHPCPHCQAQ